MRLNALPAAFVCMMVVFLVLAGCASAVARPQPTSPCSPSAATSERDQEVLSVIHRELLSGRQFVIPDQAESVQLPYALVDGSTVGDLARGDLRIRTVVAEGVTEIAVPASLGDVAAERRGCPVPSLANTLIVPAEDLDRLLRGRDGWIRFRKAYPGVQGILTLSLPVLDETGSLAGVSFGLACGMLCGYGEFVLLERREGAWRILASSYLWES